MSIDGEAREPKTQSGDILPSDEGTVTRAPRSNRTGMVLGSIAGLLILGGAVYYFAAHRADTEVATGSGSERPAASPTVASNPRTSDSSEKPPSPTAALQQPTLAEPQSPRPSEPQQSAATTPVPPPATSAPTPAAAPPSTAAAAPVTPATTAPDTGANAQPSKNEQPAESAAAAPSTAPSSATQADSAARPSMRDQPAALPDQAAAAPKSVNMLVVKRGPANIRSAPGKAGRVIGSVAKDSNVKELDRSGNWVQVETEAGTGWISSALLAQPSSESR